MARRARHRGLRLLLVLACLVGLGWFGGPWFLIWLGRSLITEQPLEKADAIAVLAGGVPSRPMEAAELYREGWAPRIILTDDQKSPGYYELAARGLRLPWTLEDSEQVVTFLGVDARAVDRIAQDFGNTLEELCGLVRHARTHRYRTLILVSDQFHTTRAAKIMALLSDGELRTIARPSRYTLYRGDRWWQSRRGARDLLFEYQKLLNHWRIAARTKVAGRFLALVGKPRTAFEALCQPAR